MEVVKEEYPPIPSSLPDLTPHLSSTPTLPLQPVAKTPQEQTAAFREKTSKLEARIAVDVWDVEAWATLVMEATQTKDIELIRDAYNRFLKVFPTAVRDNFPLSYRS